MKTMRAAKVEPNSTAIATKSSFGVQRTGIGCSTSFLFRDVSVEESYSRTLGIYGGFTNYDGPIAGFEFRNLNLFGLEI